VLDYYANWSVLLGRDWEEFKGAGEQLRQSKTAGES
jgi:hypothetical protein